MKKTILLLLIVALCSCRSTYPAQKGMVLIITDKQYK